MNGSSFALLRRCLLRIVIGKLERLPSQSLPMFNLVKYFRNKIEIVLTRLIIST